jgi:photosystem II stability/assembly factor-like uncharacterized protein
MNYLSKALVIILIYTTPFSSHSQLFWNIVNTPNSINIGCTAANNQNHIFIGATGNEGGLYKSSDNCNSWEYLGFENTGIPEIEINSINSMFLSESKYIYKSIDFGSSWEIIYSYPEPPLNVISRIACFDENIMYAAFALNNCGLIRSVDNGVNWDVVFTLPSNVEFFYDISVLNEDTVFACTTNWFDGGGVYRSTDGGYTWDLSGMYNFHCFCLEKNSIGDVFVGTYGHNTQYWLSGVYVLYHGDDEWIQLHSTLVNDMIVNSDDHLYVATDYGVLRSTDYGQTFEYINEGLFEGNVDDLAIDSSGFLYASSYDPCNMARSLVSTITAINNLNAEINPISIYNYPNPFKGTTEIWFKLTEESSASITIYDYTGKEVSVINPGSLKSGNHSVEFSSANLPSGIYFYSLEVNGIKTDTKKMTLMR